MSQYKVFNSSGIGDFNNQLNRLYEEGYKLINFGIGPSSYLYGVMELKEPVSKESSPGIEI